MHEICIREGLAYYAPEKFTQILLDGKLVDDILLDDGLAGDSGLSSDNGLGGDGSLAIDDSLANDSTMHGNGCSDRARSSPVPRLGSFVRREADVDTVEPIDTTVSCI